MMKRFLLMPLLKEYPHLRNDILQIGQLNNTKTHIDLPEDFNFGDRIPESIPAPRPTISLLNPPVRHIPTEKDLPSDLQDWKSEAQESDKGLGDFIERKIGKEKSQAFEDWFKRTFGFSCGCKTRKDWLNKMFPFSSGSVAI